MREVGVEVAASAGVALRATLNVEVVPTSAVCPDADDVGALIL